MPLSDAQYRATKKYNAKAYDRIEISVYKGDKEKIKKYAESKGKSLNAYIYDLIKEDMKKEL
jgi:predicted HicB family RNase H-like nuclease